MPAVLLDRGANAEKAGSEWSTPLEWARKRDHGEIAEPLTRAGATR